MPARSRQWAAELAPIVLLAVLAVGFLWRCNLAGETMLPADLLLIMEPWRHYQYQFPDFHQVSNPILDAIQQFYPWRKFAGESLRDGRIPFWNPYELCGNPFVGNNQSAVFYPETWLHALMPSHRALGWATSLYFFIAGSLMYWYLRLVRLGRAASLLGAIAFMFNGFVIGWLCFPSFRSVPGWLPGMLVGFELLARGRRASGVGACAAATGLQFLAGNLHISLYVLIVFGAYVGFRCILPMGRSQLRGAVVCAVGAAGAVVIGCLLASAQLLPTLELITMSARGGGKPYAEVLTFGLRPQLLLAGLMPDIFGNPVDYNHWGAQLGEVYRAYTESTFYVGVAPVLLAPLAFLYNRKQAGFWVAIVIVGALLAIGTHLNAVLYYLVPGFKALSGIGRAVVMICIAVPILGAFGTQALIELSETEGDRVRRYVTDSALAFVAVGVIGGMWVWMSTGALEEQGLPGIGDYTLLQIGRFALVAVLSVAGAMLAIGGRRRAGVGLLIICLVGDLFVYTDKFTPATNPEYLQIEARSIDVMRSAPGHPRMLSIGRDPIHRMAPNTPMIEGLEDIQGSDSLKIGAYHKLWRAMSDGKYGFEQPDPHLPVVDLLGTRFVHSAFRLPDPGDLRLISDTDGFLYENPEALPRAFSVAACDAVSGAEALAEVADRGFAPRRKVLISGGAVPKRGRRPVSAVSVQGHRPNSVALTGAFQPGQLVVLADAFFPGWQAYQGTERVPIMRANHALRAVQLQSRAETLRFVYVPGTAWVGMYATLIALGAIAGLAVASRLSRRGSV